MDDMSLEITPVTVAESVRKQKKPLGGVWEFFLYDTETKYGTCKYCNKRYKRNATRMAEHLKHCENFLASSDSHGVDLKVVRKPLSRPLILDDDAASVDKSRQEIGMEHSGTLSLDSQLISVEHGYNSDYMKTESRKRSIEGNYFPNNNSREETRDEFCVFGEHVTLELRKLSNHPILLADTKYELNQVLHKAVIECLKREDYLNVYVE